MQENVSLKNQKLLRNLRIHNILIELLKFDFSFGEESDITNESLNILNKCYILLTLFCKNNLTHKMLVEECIKYCFYHLQKYKHTQCFYLLFELFKDNKKMLFDYTLVL